METRFACQCGAYYKEPMDALAHTLNGHEVVLEQKHQGVWKYHPVPMSDYMVEQLIEKLPAESVEHYILRIERMAASV